MSKSHQQIISHQFSYPILFNRDIFCIQNDILAEVIEYNENETRIICFMDSELPKHFPDLSENIEHYIEEKRPKAQLVALPIIIQGGEECKNDSEVLNQLYQALIDNHICRHSYILAVGGGAFLDLIGYAAATAHRGIRLIRVPTTVLSQNDSGVGVKNSINFQGKKNFLGTFAPPHSVVIDADFLVSLSDRDWCAGMAEALKVALINDSQFFKFLEAQCEQLASRETQAMEELIESCALIHANHISSGGDPFECGSSRPLDFGHWAAHKLEELSHFELKHGEAVALGISLDASYSHFTGHLSLSDLQRILKLIQGLNLQIFHPLMWSQGYECDFGEGLWLGLDEFREHLGGTLTLTMLGGIGRSFEIHEVDAKLFKKSLAFLKEFSIQINPSRHSLY
ncbi:MAG: 3-dehydroquinate synthase [Planctomycetes bacterium]|nr:3-dehydroquinate synthase [Planctomycetota bacterium]